MNRTLLSWFAALSLLAGMTSALANPASVPKEKPGPAASDDELVLFSLLRENPSFQSAGGGSGRTGLQRAVDLVTLGTMEAAKQQTECRSAYDKTAVYFFLEMNETRPGVSDAVEIWLGPEGAGRAFYQFIVWRDGTIKSYLRTSGLAQQAEIQSEAIVSGSTGKWRARIKVPFASLQTGMPADNARWSFNISRDWKGEGAAGELSSWSALSAFDQVGRFGKLAFYSRAEVEADIAYWENNDNDPLLRRTTVSGFNLSSQDRVKAAPASLWSYDPFSVDRGASQSWGCHGLTNAISAANRNQSKSVEEHYPEFYRTADAINRALLRHSRTRMRMDEAKRAACYAGALSGHEAVVSRVAVDGMEQDAVDLGRRLDELFAAYRAAFDHDRDPAMLRGIDAMLTAFAAGSDRLERRASRSLRELQAFAHQTTAWSPESTTIDEHVEMRNSQGASRRFWFSAYGLYGAEPAADYFGPFRSWNIDWPFLIANRDIGGTFSLPSAQRAFGRLASKARRINFQTGVGLVSYQAPTSDWLEQRIADDPEILAWSQDRIAIPRERIGRLDAFMRRGVNIESPVTLDYLGDYLSYVVGEVSRSRPVDFILTGWEDRTELRIREQGKLFTRQRGYDPASRKAFQAYLQARYGSIERLRERWQGNRYQHFSDIQPPDDYYLKSQKATGLTLEWGRWQRESHVRWGGKLRAFIKAQAPDVPVMTDSSHLLMGGAAWAAVKGGTSDILSFHYNPANETAMFAYLESLTRRKELPLACFENYCMMYSRLEGDDEVLGARAMRRYFYDLIARDVRILSFWLGYMRGATPYIAAYGGSNFRLDTDQTILRWPSTEIVHFMEQARAVERPLVESRRETGRIAVFIPDSSILQTASLQGESSSEAPMASVVKLQNAVLGEASLPAEFLHEEMLMGNAEELDGYDVFIVQDAAFIASEALDKLRAWAALPGKTLFVVGALGFFDEYGNPLPESASPLRTAFKELGLAVEPKRPWALKPSSGGEWLQTADYGKGKVTRLARRLDQFLSEPEQLNRFKAALEQAVRRDAIVKGGQVQYQLRSGKEGRRYLLVSNRDLRKASHYEVAIRGAYPSVFDITIPGWYPIVTAFEGGQTHFKGSLQPGDWALYQLDARPPGPAGPALSYAK